MTNEDLGRVAAGSHHIYRRLAYELRWRLWAYLEDANRRVELYIRAHGARRLVRALSLARGLT